MRVVYVVTVPGAGPVSHLLTLAPAVAQEGFEVEVLCSDRNLVGAFEQAGVPARAAPLRHKFDVRGAASLLPLLQSADVVHTHDRRAGLLARPLGRARGARIVHTFHGLPHEIAPLAGAGTEHRAAPGVTRARKAWLIHGYLRIESLLAKLGAIVVPSHAVADFLVAHGLDRRRVHVIANGIDVRRSEPRPARAPLVIGTAGILEPRKGIDTLLAACAAAAVPLRLELYGDGSLRRDLEEQARALGVDARFHGNVPDVRTRLEELDLFVLASRDENLPIALLEAMAAALPVVATRVGGVPELVEDGRDGLLVEPDDPSALAAAIAALAKEPERRERLGRKASERVANDFSVEAMTGAMVALYER